MRPLALCVISLFVLAFSDPVPVTATDPAWPTNPSSPGVSYIVDRTPVVTGTLVSMTDHRVIVETDDGERMTFEYDSRSIVPELPPLSRVKLDFHLMENGNYHAERMVPIRTASGEIARGELRTSMYQDADVMRTSVYTRTDIEPEPLASSTYQASSTYEAGSAPTEATDSDAYSSTAATDYDDELPRTASAQPLIGALGMLALAGAVTLWALRREA
jgi:hypothetical protein